MRVICKFEFEIKDTVLIDMPNNSDILSVKVQNRQPCIFAKVDPNEEKRQRVFHIYSTGCQYESIKGYFIDTIQMYSDKLAFHVFDDGYKSHAA